MSYERDSRTRIITVGFIIPAAIVLVIAGNLVRGEVYLPAGRFGGELLDGLIKVVPWGWLFLGIIMIKLGLAGGLFTWYALANFERAERYTHPALVASIGIMSIGLVVAVVSAVV